MKLKEFFNQIANDFGFSSFVSIFQESYYLKFKYLGIYTVSFLGGLGITVWDYVANGSGPLNDYIRNNIYDPSKAILWLFIIVLVDIFLGISKSRAKSLVGIPEKTVQNVNGNILLRSIVKFILQVFFIMFLTNIGQLYPTMGYSLTAITHGIMLAFIIATFLSAWNNGYLLGFIQKEVHEFVVSILDVKKILSIFKPTLPKKHEDQESKSINTYDEKSTGGNPGIQKRRRRKSSDSDSID